MTVAVKQGDVGSKITATLLDDNNPADLTGATVKFLMAAGRTTAPLVNAAATVVSATQGKVSYTWQAADLVPGTYIAEWEVTYPGGVVVTYPTTGYIDVKIYDDLST